MAKRIAKINQDRKKELEAGYKQAALDPAYIEDMEAITREFEPCVKDGLEDDSTGPEEVLAR